MKETLNYLFGQNNLTKHEARDILKRIASGEFSEPEIASFLTVFIMRPITADELSGFREALLELCVPLDLGGMPAIDVCGTGGDEKNTFNISTLTAFVLAGAGIKVVKHGNYSVSSACGSSNVFEHFGYQFSNQSDKLLKELEKTNICYLHAPLFHPAMKSVGPVRKAMKVKTFFNMLGPIVNPALPSNQLVGVFNEEVFDLYMGVFKGSGINHSIVYSLDGYDEISLTSDFHVGTDNGKEKYSPSSLNLPKLEDEDLYGGNTVKEAVKIFKNILEGNGTEAQNSVVLANAAFGIKTAFPGKGIEDCIAEARESLEGKKALDVFNKLFNML